MKSKGFTLIEVLAIIILLGVISLIVIPTVSRVLDESKMESLKVTAENIINSKDDYISNKKIDNITISETTFNFPEDKNLLGLTDVDGEGFIKFEASGRSVIAISKGKYCAYKNYNKNKINVIKLNDDQNCSDMVSLIIRDKSYVKKNWSGDTFLYEDFKEDAYRNKIINAFLTYDEEVPSDAIKSWDISKNGDKSIMSWLTANGTNYDLHISSKNDIALDNESAKLFAHLKSLENITLDNFNTSGVTNMESMFNHCEKLKTIDATKFDTSNVTDMSGMFFYASSLTNVDLSPFDVSKVTTFDDFFAYGINLKSLNTDGWNTSKVDNLIGFFFYCINLEEFDMSSFDTTKVKDMYDMFAFCSKLTEIDIHNFKTPNLTNLYGVFRECTNLTKVDISNLDTSKVVNMAELFYNTPKLTTIDLSSFTVSSTTNTNVMFSKTTALVEIKVSNKWTKEIKLADFANSGIKVFNVDTKNYMTIS